MSEAESATGITCPRCGGAIWNDQADKALAFHCRIGHRFSLGAMLVEHGSRRRETLVTARRFVAESAALKRLIADWARTHGHNFAAARLDQEAETLDGTGCDLERVAGSVHVPQPPGA